MKTIKVCKIGENWGLGQVLGNARHDTCWAVECDEYSPGAIERETGRGVKWYRRFNTFHEAEKFCIGE